MDDYLTLVGKDPLLKEQGLHELRHGAAGEGLSGIIQDFLRQQEDSPVVRAGTYTAYEHVGDIYKEMSRFAETLASYDRGLAVARARQNRSGVGGRHAPDGGGAGSRPSHPRSVR